MKSCNIAAYPIAKARGLCGGFSVMAIKYRADFGYNRVVKVGSEVHLEPVVEDVKGYRTKDYELKKKFLAGKGIEVTEI